MKKFQLILILVLFFNCITEEQDECSKQFESLLLTKCESINSTCKFDLNYEPSCIPLKNNFNNCRGKPDGICQLTVHKDFPKKKCVWNEGGSECEEKETTCNDYNSMGHKVNGIKLRPDDCYDLKPNDGFDKCRLSNSGACQSYYNECKLSNCEFNILANHKATCHLINEGTPPSSSCVAREDRKCDNYLKNVNKQQCYELKTSDDNKKRCVFFENDGCIEKPISCSGYIDPDYPLQTDCDGNTPLIQNGNEFDYNYICKFISSGTDANQCKPVFRLCEEYSGDDASICIGLKAKDPNKRCVYSPSKGCYEEYSQCELYTSKKIETNRGDCEDILLLEENKKCVYIREIDKCETKTDYSNCDKYPGNDKSICESIISPNTQTYCILDKDSICKERPLFCSEVPLNKEKDCLYTAKATDENKRCAYNENDQTCYEEYIRCEDYLENDTSTCEAIRLYNGKKCQFESNRCRSINKECVNATTEEECKLIAQTGVADKEKKICQWINGNACIENYKYCSDCRGKDIGLCAYIEPFDDSGNEKDITSKCVADSSVGCERIPKECSDGNGNPILCALISPKIIDSNEKYCAYIGSQCVPHYKTCENYIDGNSETYDNTFADTCTNIVPENYLSNRCKYEKVGDIYKCITDLECTTFSVKDKAVLCRQINPNCSYSSGVCKTEEKTCSGTKFYTKSEENEETCKKMEASEPYKSCVLKDDLSGCEEKYKELSYSTAYSSYSTSPGENEGSSSGYIKKGIHFIIILLCLLF